MRFLTEPTTDLTYSDLFLVPSRSDVTSRLDVDLAADDGTGSAIPLVAANMTAVTGKRMAETMARRGGLAVLPQDVPLDVIRDVTAWIKTRHPVLETPVTLSPADTVIDALHLMGKRPHGAVTVVDDSGAVTGIVRAADCEGQDRFASLGSVLRHQPLVLDAALLDDAPDGGRIRRPGPAPGLRRDGRGRDRLRPRAAGRRPGRGPHPEGRPALHAVPALAGPGRPAQGGRSRRNQRRCRRAGRGTPGRRGQCAGPRHRARPPAEDV